LRPTIPQEIFAVVAVSALLAATLAGAAVLRVSRDMLPATIDDIATSAPVAFSDLHIHADIADTLPPVAPGDASLFYSTDAQATWTETTLGEVAGSPDTWGTTVPMPDGELAYRFLVLSDSAAAFTGPKNQTNAFPPPANVMVDPDDEPDDDATLYYTEACEITNARFGYSDTHVYATLTNATGSWPQSGGIIGPWYIYSAAVANPDAPQDSIGLAMVYADVPILGQTGLYWADARDSSFVRIGDIEATVTGGELHMRCEIADLIAHPDFGPDNPSGYYLMGAGSGTAVINGDQWVNDQTSAYSFHLRTDTVAPGANTAPSLAGGDAAPATEPPDTLVRFNVTYTDPDGHLAAVRDVVIDGNAYAMGCPGPDRGYAAGVEFEVDVALSEGEHTYYFSFSDGDLAATTAPAIIDVETGVPDGPPAALLAFRSAWPQPSASGVRLAFFVPSGNGSINIYDLKGRRVRSLWTGGAGEHEARWDMRDDAGRRAASGVYFAVLRAGDTRVQRKLVVLR